MRVLITGKSSRIGNRLKQHMEQAGGYTADTISMRTDDWKSVDFSAYGAVVHLAAIAHTDDAPGEEEYTRVNTQLTYEAAQKAKAEGVGCFVFLSTMGVYGVEGDVNRMVIIDGNTPLNPDSLYGKSKLEGEQLISALADDSFAVCSLRPPLVYGKDCKGNYARLKALAQKLPFMPKLDNQRSMIHVVNLCEFIRLLIEQPATGTYFPQNREYVNTQDMLGHIAAAEGRRMRFSGLMGWLVRKPLAGMGVVKKVFGNLVYDKDMSATFDSKYCIRDFEHSFDD